MKIIKYILIICFSITISLVSTKVYSAIEDNVIGNLNETDYVMVTVKEGDTIWTIAKPYYNGKSDYRDLIYDIKTINKLEQYIIHPGQKIAIPLL